METRPGAGGTAERINQVKVGGPMDTRSLLRSGILAGPFYLTVGLIQAFLRDGFDLGRHPLSVLANGAGGWVQTANFVLTGLMVLAASVAFGRVLGAMSRGLAWFLGGYGLALLLGAGFPADPVDGFPPGTPQGMPASISPTGLIHFAAGALAFTCLAISCFFAARVMSRRNEAALARLSLFSGLAVGAGFFGGMALPLGILGIWLAVIVGWAWLSIMSLHLYRVTTSA